MRALIRGRARGRLSPGRAVPAVVLMLLGATRLVVPAAAAPPEPHHDIESYILFAFDGQLTLKGGDNGRGVFSGGNIGANALATAVDPVIRLCENGSVHMDAGTHLAADAIKVGSDPCTLGSVFANSLVGPVPFTAFTPPVVADVPVIPAFACDAAEPLVVGKNQTDDATPGTYGELDVQDGATLDLAAGTYVFCKVKVGENATVTTHDGTTILVAGTWDMRAKAAFGPACDVTVWARGDGVGANDDTLSFANGTGQDRVHGHFIAPAGKVGLGNSTDIFGKVWAGRIHDDFDVNVAPCSAPPPTTTTAPSSSTTVPASSTTVTVAGSTTSTLPDPTTTTTAPVSPSTTTTVAGATTTVQAAGSTLATARSSTTAAARVSAGRPLPRTGGDAGREGATGLALVVAGAALLAAARRPRAA